MLFVYNKLLASQSTQTEGNKRVILLSEADAAVWKCSRVREF